MEQGVVDTVVESILLGGNRPESNTSDLFARRDTDNTNWVAIHKSGYCRPGEIESAARFACSH